ncbi:MAG: methyltransferase domain-containing protein, partial [Verrucomicrobiota bacterium]
MAIFLFSLAGIIAVLVLLNFVSYRLFGARIRNRREKWDLNICCGRTDGGGVNADIVKHAEVPNYVQVEDIYDLPFRTGQFENVLCSHTLEHVEDPEAFFEELSRVAKEVTIVLPPLWDLSAVLNVFEHKWIFFSF